MRTKRRFTTYLSTILALTLFFSLAIHPQVFAAQQTVSGIFDYSSAHAMLEQVNASRQASGLAPLAYDYNLEWFAKTRAAELTILNAHERPDGTLHPYGENYSIGWSSVPQAMSSFLASPSHSANIFGGYSSMAAAVFSSSGSTYWVQIFASGSDPGVPNGLSGTSSESLKVNVSDAQAGLAGNYDDNLKLQVGSYIIVKAGVNGQMVSGSWSSSDPSVATVDQSGKVVGVAPGSAVITGSFGGTTKTILVQVGSSQGRVAPQSPAVQNTPQPPAASADPIPETPTEGAADTTAQPSAAATESAAESASESSRKAETSKSEKASKKASTTDKAAGNVKKTASRPKNSQTQKPNLSSAAEKRTRSMVDTAGQMGKGRASSFLRLALIFLAGTGLVVSSLFFVLSLRKNLSH